MAAKVFGTKVSPSVRTKTRSAVKVRVRIYRSPMSDPDIWPAYAGEEDINVCILEQ